jgi:hypothetical protein
MAISVELVPECGWDARIDRIIDACNLGRQEQEARDLIRKHPAEALLPILDRVERAWIYGHIAERDYHRRAFRESLGALCLWTFLAMMGLAPFTALAAFSLISATAKTQLLVASLIAAVLGAAWLRAPRIPPWNVWDSRTCAAWQVAEQVLDSLHPNDAFLLDERHHAALQRLLAACANDRSTTYNERLALSLINALKSVGDGLSVRSVERLTRHSSEPLRRAAEACLPSLRERLSRELTSGSLLRPVPPPPAADELLRPASSIISSYEALLRPLESMEKRAA